MLEQLQIDGVVAAGSACGDRATTARRPTTQRLLVAWFHYSLNGGISRFLNIARTLRSFGHQVEFLSLSDDRSTEWVEFPGRILTLDEARAGSWDAVMVPGAGADPEVLGRLGVLRDPRFGLRVQHILNDTSSLAGFRCVNEVLDPHVVVANNSAWQPRDFHLLSAGAFHVLPGAVDTELFYPLPLKGAPAEPPHWSIGAYAGRTLAPVLAAIEQLPEGCVLHLFGGVPAELAGQVRELMHAGRLEVHGELIGQELADFYRDMDIVVAAQHRAGWCNPAAEAMACGVPAVVARHGTVDFAVAGDNALVLETIDGPALAAAVRRLTVDGELRTRLARNAAASMRRWSWSRYCEGLLSILHGLPVRAYFRIPELGLYGKWEPETRVAGLESLLAHAAGGTLLDLGGAEGVVGWVFARHGARLVHGIELDAGRVRFANEVLGPAAGAEWMFRQANLADWPRFAALHDDLLLDAYDVVLLLGVYHHLPPASRRDVLAGALARSRTWFAIRTPARFVQEDDLVGLVESQGFELVEQVSGIEGEAGWLGVFRRRPPSGGTAGRGDDRE